MQTYLVIITTALVITQIIRLTQNTIQLKRYDETYKRNDNMLKVWEQIDRGISDIKKLLESKDDKSDL